MRYLVAFTGAGRAANRAPIEHAVDSELTSTRVPCAAVCGAKVRKWLDRSFRSLAPAACPKCVRLLKEIGTGEALYFILSVKNGHGDACLWWRPPSKGYTSDLGEAGEYTLSDARRAVGGARYLDDNIPVPCAEALRLAKRTVQRDLIREREWRAAAAIELGRATP